MGSGYRVELESSAPPSRIYDLLADAAAWEKWAPLVGHSELIRRGSPDPLGAGAIRRVSGLKVLRAEEEIVDARRPDYQRYTAQGLPVTGYRGEVRLNAVEAGTQLIWTGTFEPRVPGTSWLIAGFFRMAITLLARRAIAIAEKPTADR